MSTATPNQIAQALFEACEGKKDAEIKDITENTAKFLMQKNMLGKGTEVMKKFTEIYNRENGIVVATIESKEALLENQSEDLKKRIADKYQAKAVEIESIVDPNLIGGIKVTVEDEVMDYTLKTQLKKLQRALS